MSVNISKTFEAELEQAHLLYVRGEYDRARMVLTTLSARYPGSSDGEDLLAKVVLAQDRSRARPRRRRLTWRAVLARDFSPRLTEVSLAGLLCLVEAGVFIIPALQARFGHGFGSWMVVRHNGFPYLLVWQELAIGSGFLAFGCALLYSFYRHVFYEN